MAGIDFWVPTQIVLGEGTLLSMGERVVALGARRVMIITDAVIAKTEPTQRLVKGLTDLGVETCVFTDVDPNPTTRNVNAGIAMANAHRPEALIAIGGGSVIDAGKAISILLTNGGAVEDYVGRDRLTRPIKPFFAIPTTAGTGSEVSRAAVITNSSGDKMVIFDARIAPCLSIVDPEVTYSCPSRLTAVAGMDAVTHAIESYASRGAKVMTEPLSIAALRLLAGSIHAAVADGQDKAARYGMAAGSNMAAIGMSFAGLGICHSLANPLTKHLELPHGLACAMVLPWVMRFNWSANPKKHAEIAEAWVGGSGPEEIVEMGVAFVSRLGLPTRLADVGLTRSMISQMAGEALGNPANSSSARPVTASDLAMLLQQAL